MRHDLSGIFVLLFVHGGRTSLRGRDLLIVFAIIDTGPLDHSAESVYRSAGHRLYLLVHS